MCLEKGILRTSTLPNIFCFVAIKFGANSDMLSKNFAHFNTSRNSSKDKRLKASLCKSKTKCLAMYDIWINQLN